MRPFCEHLFLCKQASWFLFNQVLILTGYFFTQFCGFLFGEIHNFAEKLLTQKATLSFLALAIEEGKIFENKFFIMCFKMFWKLTTVKISIYTVKASCVILVHRLKLAKVIIKLIDPFSSCRTTTVDVNTLKQNSQCMNTVLQNMNGNWKLLL